LNGGGLHQAGLLGLSDHLKRLLAHGDPLEELGRIIDCEAFRLTLVAALAYGDGAKGGRPSYDPRCDAQGSGAGGSRIMLLLHGWSI
jgi:hypothetical protein